MGNKNSSHVLASIKNEIALKRNLNEDVSRYKTELDSYLLKGQKLIEDYKSEKSEIEDEILKYTTDFNRLHDKHDKYKILIDEVLSKFEKESKRFQQRLDQLQECFKVSKIEKNSLTEPVYFTSSNVIDIKLFELKEKQMHYSYKIERAEMNLDFSKLKKEFNSINNKKDYLNNLINDEIIKYENCFNCFETRCRQLSDYIRLRREEIEKELIKYQNESISPNKDFLVNLEKVLENFYTVGNQISEYSNEYKSAHDTESNRFKIGLNESIKKHREAKGCYFEVSDTFKKIKLKEKDYFERHKIKKLELIKLANSGNNNLKKEEEETYHNLDVLFETIPLNSVKLDD